MKKAKKAKKAVLKVKNKTELVSDHFIVSRYKKQGNKIIPDGDATGCGTSVEWDGDKYVYEDGEEVNSGPIAISARFNCNECEKQRRGIFYFKKMRAG